MVKKVRALLSHGFIPGQNFCSLCERGGLAVKAETVDAVKPLRPPVGGKAAIVQYDETAPIYLCGPHGRNREKLDETIEALREKKYPSHPYVQRRIELRRRAVERQRHAAKSPASPAPSAPPRADDLLSRLGDLLG